MPEKKIALNAINDSKLEKLSSIITSQHHDSSVIIKTDNEDEENEVQEEELYASEYEHEIKIIPRTESNTDETESHHYLNENFYENPYEKCNQIKRDRTSTQVEYKRQDMPQNQIPQALISCLNELQHGGNLISWKIVGHGENLTVKVTWNNDEKKKSKYTLSSNKLIVNELNNQNIIENLNESLTDKDDQLNSTSELDMDFVYKKYESNSKVRNELGLFRSKLKHNIKEFINGLDEISAVTKSIENDKDEYNDLIYLTRNNLKLILNNIKQIIYTDLKKLEPKDFNLERSSYLLIINEIEKCVKSRSGKILKEIEILNDYESHLIFKKLEEQLSSLIIRKYLSKRKFTSLVDLLGKFIEQELENDKKTKKSIQKQVFKSNSNTLEDDFDYNEHEDEVENESDASIGKYRINNKNNLKATNSKTNLLLSLNSLINKNNCPHDNNNHQLPDSDLDLISTGERSESEWQENWSFIERSRKTTGNSEEVYSTIDQFTSNNSPVILSKQEPIKEEYQTIDQQDDKLSDATINERGSSSQSAKNNTFTEENFNENENQIFDIDKAFVKPNDVDLNKSMTKSADNITMTTILSEESRIPKNIINSRINQAKSSSYYRQNDDRLESDPENETMSNSFMNKSLNKSCDDDPTRIKPKHDINDPKFELRPSDRLVRCGETVKFISKVNGTKPLEVFWFKMNGDELQNDEKYEIYHDDEYHYLKIYNTLQKDSGMYLCVISNDIDQNIDSFSLKLRENNRQFKSPKFLIELEDIEVDEGYSATFKVKVDFGYPKSRILFYRNGDLILNDHKHEIYYCGEGIYHLHIPNVTDEDNAQYTCVAINNGGRVISNAELYVLEKEHVRRPDMMLKLRSSSFKSLGSPIQSNRQLNPSDLIKDTKFEDKNEIQIETLNDNNNNENFYSPIKSINSNDIIDSSEIKSDSNVFTNTTGTVSISSYDLWLDSIQHITSNNNQKNSEDPCLLKENDKLNSLKEAEENGDNSILTHIERLNSSFNKILLDESDEQKLVCEKTENIVENIDMNLQLVKQINQTIITSHQQPHHLNRQQQSSHSILNAINLEKRNSLLTNSNKEEKFVLSLLIENKDQSNKTDPIIISKTRQIEQAKSELEEKTKSFKVTNSEAVQNEYKEFKIEPVKNLKKLWESQVLTHIALKQNESKSNNQFNKSNKKWSSMQSINQSNNESLQENSMCNMDIKTDKLKTTQSKIKPDEDVRKNMSNLLDEIKRFEFSKSAQNLDKNNSEKKLKTKFNSNDSLNVTNDSDTAKLVEKLKQKFDHKDKAFTKIASLTCRSLLAKEVTGGSSKTVASSRPLMSLYEHHTEKSNAKISKIPRLVKSESVNNLQTISNSISPDSHLNISESKLATSKHVLDSSQLKKANSLSSHSISSSSFGTRSSSSTYSESLSCNTNSQLVNRNHTITSQSSFNREIKSLLDIAENRTKQLCKVYDSSLNDDENNLGNNMSNSNVELNTKLDGMQKRANLNKYRLSFNNTLNENTLKPNDYKSIINMNYLKSNKKQSNVISKVKLWDQMVETGRLNTDKWDKEFS